MAMMRNILTSMGALAFVWAAAPSAYAADMKSPDTVKKSLGTLTRVVAHTQRLIDAKNYDRIPHENEEFKEGAEALEKSVAGEPADFKTKIDPLLKQAEADSQAVADAAKAHDDAKLASTHATFDASVKTVVAAFPASVQPPPPAPPKK